MEAVHYVHYTGPLHGIGLAEPERVDMPRRIAIVEDEIAIRNNF